MAFCVGRIVGNLGVLQLFGALEFFWALGHTEFGYVALLIRPAFQLSP